MNDIVSFLCPKFPQELSLRFDWIIYRCCSRWVENTADVEKTLQKKSLSRLVRWCAIKDQNPSTFHGSFSYLRPEYGFVCICLISITTTRSLAESMTIVLTLCSKCSLPMSRFL